MKTKPTSALSAGSQLALSFLSQIPKTPKMTHPDHVTFQQARKRFGENVLREITANNYTQAEFGRMIGVKQPMVNAIVAGRIMPSFDRIVKMHLVLELEPGELFR